MSWSVLIEEPAPRGPAGIREVSSCASRADAEREALAYAKSFEPLEPAKIIGRRIFRSSPSTLLVILDGLTTRRWLRLHIIEDLT